MDERDDFGLRIVGTLAGIVALLFAGGFALALLQYGIERQCCLAEPVDVVADAVAVCLVLATLATAMGQAWGALVIALYGGGLVALFLSVEWFSPTARWVTTGDAFLVALHVAIAVVALAVAFGLARAPLRPRAD